MHEDLQLFFQLADQNNFQKVDHSYDRTVNNEHGRIETRECWTVSGDESLHFLRDHEQWKGLRTIAMVRSQRQMNGQTIAETRYYISSLAKRRQKDPPCCP
jgi:hypothetical protein